MNPRDPRPESDGAAGIDEVASRCSALSMELLSYMATSPNAEDTLEGIAGWWLLSHRIRSRTARVRGALDELVEHELVLAIPSDRGMRFRVNPERLAEVLELCGQRERCRS